MAVASILLAEDRHTLTVTEVVDGDTLRVIYEGKEEQIRLDGIDTPECWAHPKAERDSQRCGKDLKHNPIEVKRSF